MIPLATFPQVPSPPQATRVVAPSRIACCGDRLLLPDGGGEADVGDADVRERAVDVLSRPRAPPPSGGGVDDDGDALAHRLA